MRSVELFKSTMLLKNSENKAQESLKFNGSLLKDVQDQFSSSKSSSNASSETSQIQFSGKSGFFTQASKLTIFLAALNLGSMGIAEAKGKHERGHHRVKTERVHHRHNFRMRRAKPTCETAPLRDYLPDKLFSHAGGGIEVTQLTNEEGDPIRQSQISIPIPRNTKLCDDNGVGFDVLVKDPTPDPEVGEDVILAATVERVFIDKGKRGRKFLNFVINGPVSEGSFLELPKGLLLLNGKVNEAGDIELKNKKYVEIDAETFPPRFQYAVKRYNNWVKNFNEAHGSTFLSPDEATPWFKALAPVDSNKSQFLSYGVSNSDPADLQPTEINTVFNSLETHFDKKVELGLLTPERAKEVLDMFDKPEAQDVFTDEFGELNTHLFAAALSTAGTVLDGAMEALLGENDTGMAVKVFYGAPLDPNLDLEVRIIDGQMNVFVEKGAEFAAFELVGTGLGHELFHQDAPVTQNEEIIASVAQTVAYAQQLLVNPKLASENVFSTHFNNTWLLTLMNSGKVGFPNPGLEKAPTLQREMNLNDQALPDGSSSSFTSFKDGRIKAFYSDTPLGNSPGNDFLRKVASKIAGGKEFPVIDFDTRCLEVFDNIQALTSEQWHKVEAILKLSFDPNVVD